MSPGASTTNLAISSATVASSYSVVGGGSSVATVDTNSGEVTIQGVGTVQIEATNAGDANYNSTTARYVLEVEKAEQTGFRFVDDSIIEGYKVDKIVNNPITGGQSTGEVTYSIDNTGVATIGLDSGQVTLRSTGTAIVTANKAGDRNYLPTSATYSLKVVDPLMTLGIKNIKFDWQNFVTTATNHYLLQSNLGNDGTFVDASTIGFVVTPNSTNITQTNARADIALHRYVPLISGDTDLIQYQIKACEARDVCDIAHTARESLNNNELNELIGYFKASDTAGGHRFGSAVSLSDDGNTLAVGARRGRANTNGAVYIFVRDSSTAEWTQQQAIQPPTVTVISQFGWSVSLSGDGNTLAVGGNFQNFFIGGAYVFARDSSSVWKEQAYRTITKASASFGVSVSLDRDGDTLAVGASYSVYLSGNPHRDSGEVYVFVRDSSSNWSDRGTIIKGSNTKIGDEFGWSVSLNDDGDTLAVGARFEDSSATGVNGADNDSAGNAGAVYVFTRSSATWSQQAYIKASNTGAGDEFGTSVVFDGDGNTLVVGAVGEDSSATGVNGLQGGGASNAGAAYVFVRDSSSNWNQQAYVKASNTDAGDLFGYSVSLDDDGNTLVVGAVGEKSNSTGVNSTQIDNSFNNHRDLGREENQFLGAGAAYVFIRNGEDWRQQAYVKAKNTGLDEFGVSVNLSGDGNTLAVGAQKEGSSSTGINGRDNDNASGAGAVYLY